MYRFSIPNVSSFKEDFVYIDLLRIAINPGVEGLSLVLHWTCKSDFCGNSKHKIRQT